MTSKCYETSMTYYDETFGGETYFICLTIVLFPDSPAPVRERECVSQMDTHPNIPDLSLLHKRVWGSDSKRSSICGFCQLSKSTCCQYQIERAKNLFPLISPQAISGWGEDLINLNLEKEQRLLLKLDCCVASLLTWWKQVILKKKEKGSGKTDVMWNGPKQQNSQWNLNNFIFLTWILHSPIC